LGRWVGAGDRLRRHAPLRALAAFGPRLNAANLGVTCGVGFGCFQNGNRGKSLNTSFEGLDFVQGGGVIFF
jgi:hypothetical protein